MKLTEIKKAPSINATDIVHVVLINDTSQDPKGSSYKAEIGQLINFASTSLSSPITIVNNTSLVSTKLVGTGTGAVSISNSNFFGPQAGQTATAANNSNFIGNEAGNAATNAKESNFFGSNAGKGGINANGSNFFGTNAGKNAPSASYSNLFGYNVGNGENIGGIFSNNIIIGTNISLPSGTANSINLGGVLFGTNTYATPTGPPSTVGQTNGRIGINKVIPTTTLHIYSETANSSGLRLERLTSSSPTSTGQAIGVDANGTVITITAATGGGGTFNGGTVNNATIFTNGLTANTIFTNSLTANTIVTTGLTANTINTNGLTANTINTNGLTAGTISATTYLNLPINLQRTVTSSFIIADTDNNHTIIIANGISPVTITIPSGRLSKINVGFIQQGSGDVTIAAGSGVVINTPISGAFKIKGQNYNAYIEQVGASNVYQLLGNLKV
jgi:hypothetical protein